MKKIAAITFLLIALQACSTMKPARYSISVDNIQSMKEYEGLSARVLTFNKRTDFSNNCRMMGPIEAADGQTVASFIKKAMNDEFKMAEIYSEDGITLDGIITKIEFSSMDGLTNGHWEIEVQLNSSNGKSMTAYNNYRFSSGFDAITACNATADALSPAVQDLINIIVNNPSFRGLITPEE